MALSNFDDTLPPPPDLECINRHVWAIQDSEGTPRPDCPTCKETGYTRAGAEALRAAHAPLKAMCDCGSTRQPKMEREIRTTCEIHTDYPLIWTWLRTCPDCKKTSLGNTVKSKIGCAECLIPH